MIQPQGAWMLVLNGHTRDCEYRSSNLCSDGEHDMAVGWTKDCYDNTRYDGWYDKNVEGRIFFRPSPAMTRPAGRGL